MQYPTIPRLVAVLAGLTFVASSPAVLAQSGQSSPTNPPQTTPPPAWSTSTSPSTDDLDEVRPFQAWMTDSAITQELRIEPVADYGNGDNYTTFFLGAQGALSPLEGLELGARFGLVSFDPDGFDGQSGLSDLSSYARYRIDTGVPDFDLALGGSLDLPIGDEDVGQSNFDFSAFAAARFAVVNGMKVLASGGLLSQETRNDRNNGIFLGTGALIPVAQGFAAISEFNFASSNDFAAITGGVDYTLAPGGHARAGLSIGLDNGADDVKLFLAFAIPVR